MKHRRDKHAKTAPAAVPLGWPERLRGLIDVLAIALVAATPLVPSEGAIREGAFAVLATCWCLLFVGWSALAFATPGSVLRLDWTEVVGGLLVAWHSLAAIVWLGSGNDRQGLNALWLFVGYGLAVLLLRQVVTSAQRARALIALVLWLAATLAATGYVQYFVTMPALRAAYERNPERVLRERGVSVDPDSPQRLLFENRLQSVEPLATFALTNSLAGLVAPWLIVALAVGLAVLQEPGLRRTLIGAALLAAFLGGCLLLTKSRTAVLAVLTGLVLLPLYGRRSNSVGGLRIGWRLPAIAVGALVVIGLGVVYVGGLDAKVLSEAPKSVLYRLEYWRSTAAMIADYPFFGCGPGNFQETYAAYKLPQASEMVADPHNFLLEVWAAGGTPAIGLLLALFAAWAVDLMRLSRGEHVRESKSLAESTAQPRPATLYFAGGALGLVLGFALAALAGFPLDSLANLPVPVVWLVGAPLLALVWWLFGPWVEHGELPVGAVVVAMIVLATNLLAAGAVVFPGVVVTALVLLPTALQLATKQQDLQEKQPTALGSSWRSRLPAQMPLSRPAAGVIWAVALAITILCLWTQYRPVLTAGMNLQTALFQLERGDAAAAERAVRAAAEADPWSPEPWRLASELRFRRFMSDPSPAAWSEFSSAADEFRARSPRQHGQLFQRGNWHFLAWQRSSKRISVLQGDGGRALTAQQPVRLAEALASYQQAINRYPNSALYYGQLAWALNAAGQPAEARAAADRAQALDDAMPHTDQKLAHQRIVDWQSSLPPMGPYARPETAEQTVQQLRKTSTR